MCLSLVYKDSDTDGVSCVKCRLDAALILLATYITRECYDDSECVDMLDHLSVCYLVLFSSSFVHNGVHRWHFSESWV